MRRNKLTVVPDGQPLDMGNDIYAEDREKREDRERWAKMHIEADRRNLPRRWWS
jgi:hypothetical protein